MIIVALHIYCTKRYANPPYKASSTLGFVEWLNYLAPAKLDRAYVYRRLTE